MILVVFAHVESFTFELWPPTFLNELFLLFRMPLFFFISGFIGYKAGVVWDRRVWWMLSRRKLLVQLRPTILFGSIYAYGYLHVGWDEFVKSDLKLGYWFTIVLLEMFLIVYTLNWLLYKSVPRAFKSWQFGALVAVSILFLSSVFVLQSSPSLCRLGDILSLHSLFKYFPYFALGYICAMDRERFYRVLDNRYFVFVAIILFACVFCVNKCFLQPHKDVSMACYAGYHGISFLLGFLGLLIVFNTFRVYSSTFSLDTKVGRALQYIGKRTLDIYLLHYFLLPHMPQFGGVLFAGKNIALELVGVGILSLVVVGLCLVVSNILRTNPLLAKYLFGAKNVQPKLNNAVVNS